MLVNEMLLKITGDLTVCFLSITLFAELEFKLEPNSDSYLITIETATNLLISIRSGQYIGH